MSAVISLLGIKSDRKEIKRKKEMKRKVQRKERKLNKRKKKLCVLQQQ
jgi:hypothetical protein